ncbi:MAG: RNA polymerase sigma factor [Tannerellaceae bacterium]|nr:RNA polymerase sigma factor [Tannerellaceae bacterium]
MESARLIEVIEKSKQKDNESFRLLVEEYQLFVFRLCFRLMGDVDEARDMVQETFIKLWTSLHLYQNTFRFSTWLYKITCNTCLDRLRKLSQRPETDADKWGDYLEQLSSGENIESGIINQELKELILYFTEQLAPKQKLVFILSDIEDLEVSEIETITGLSAAKIKSNLYLARKYIRQKLDTMEE